MEKKQLTSAEVSPTQNVELLGAQTYSIIDCAAPYWKVPHEIGPEYLQKESSDFLANMHFFRLNSLTGKSIEDLAEYLQKRMEKLFAAIHSLNRSVAYGVVSTQSRAQLVLGVETRAAQAVIEPVIQGLLTGIEMESCELSPSQPSAREKMGGLVAGVPVLKVDEEPQRFDIAPLMRSLNGQDYAVLLVARPVDVQQVEEWVDRLRSARDCCVGVSKSNVARMQSRNESNSTTLSLSLNRRGLLQELLHQLVRDRSLDVGGLVDALIDGGIESQSASLNNSATELGEGITISQDFENSLALELMELCDRTLARLRQGQATGVWRMAISYSAENEVAAGVLRSCLCGELAKPAADILPLRQFSFPVPQEKIVLLPAELTEGKGAALCPPVTSAELGMVCTPPAEPVPHFELRRGMQYPMIASPSGGVEIGVVTDGMRPLSGMKFSLSHKDLNKHTVVCGMTGTGKTTAVKGILERSGKPFLVIEAAKKEYRGLRRPDKAGPLIVYTLGKSELNSLQMNPFYIQQGVSLQTHIDFLKDLFNASFSFYGPMPYILEKCLHNIYAQRGWNLTLGYHPYLVDLEHPIALFDADYMRGRYEQRSHCYVFPTMRDLQVEVNRYVEDELHYHDEARDNIKTAIVARLESLCVGAKGFMFNTNRYLDLQTLMQQDAVFELEGLADDADKAFCIGLLLIFINEYRQVFQEKRLGEKPSLQHLLVIEEAHRLLKNVETERVSEQMGNPKGKAVEHFTNMIAEMRAYGQGVIISEQIPGKLAPDVIKNASNKVVQRLSTAADQSLMANAIGMTVEEAVYLGGLQDYRALCYKEGMSLPVHVQVYDVEKNIVSDASIFHQRELEVFADINESLVMEATQELAQQLGVKLLNTILAQSDNTIAACVKACWVRLRLELEKKRVTLIACRDERIVMGKILAMSLMELLTTGIYRIGGLIPEEIAVAVEQLCVKGLPEHGADVRAQLRRAYMRECDALCVELVAEQLVAQLNIDDSKGVSVELEDSMKNYFHVVTADLVKRIGSRVTHRRGCV